MFDLGSALNQLLPPLPQNSDVVTYTVKVNNVPVPQQFLPSAISVYKAANRIPYALLSVVDGDVPNRRFEASDSDLYVPGHEIEIKAGYRSSEDTIFKGIVVRHQLKVRANQPAMLEVECKDLSVKLTAGRKNKYFFDKTDQEIIEEILRSYSGVQADVADTNGTHQEMVQYFATDWDFIVSRAEANGMLVFANDGTIAVAPPDFDQEAAFPLQFGTSIFEFEAEMDARDQYPAAKASTWNPADQELREVEASAGGAQALGGGFGAAVRQVASVVRPIASAFGVNLPGLPPDTDYSQVMGWPHFAVQHPGHFKQEEVQNWAESQYQKSKLAKMRGRVKFEGVADIAPGQCLNLQGVGQRHEGKIFVTALTHEISNGAWTTQAQFGLSRTWFAQEFADVADTPAAALVPPVHGLQIGVVTKLENDPDGEDRIQVRLPLVTPQGEGIWMRMACQDAGNNRGSFWRPEVQDEVLVGFLNDDPREAVVLGMLNSSNKPAPLPAADQNHEKGWVTRSGIRVIFNDDKKSLVIETPGGKKMTIDDDAGNIKIEDENNNSITMDANGIVIESAKDLTLKAAQNLKIEAPNITNTAQASFKAEAQGQAQITASGDLVVKGAFVRIN